MARRGQAYNLKRAPERVIEQCKLNVKRRLDSKYQVYKEEDINNNEILLDYAIDDPLNEPLVDSSDTKANGSLTISDEEIRAKIAQIKSKKSNAPHQQEKVDLNNNIVNNLLNENSLLKER